MNDSSMSTIGQIYEPFKFFIWVIIFCAKQRFCETTQINVTEKWRFFLKQFQIVNWTYQIDFFCTNEIMSRTVPYRLECPEKCLHAQDEALNSTFFILRQTGPTAFVLKEEDERTYKVKYCL